MHFKINILLNFKLIDNYFLYWSILQNKNMLGNDQNAIKIYLKLQELVIVSLLVNKLFLLCAQTKLGPLTNQLLFNHVYLEGFEDHFNIWLVGGLLLSLYCQNSTYRNNFGPCGQLLYSVFKIDDNIKNKSSEFFLHSYFTGKVFGLRLVTMPITLYIKKLSKVLIFASNGMHLCNGK